MWLLSGALQSWFQIKGQHRLLSVQPAGSLFPNYFSLLLSSSVLVPTVRNPFWKTQILVLFHAKAQQSYLEVGQKRESIPRSEPRLSLPPGKGAVRVGWAEHTGSWKEPEKRKWDRQKKKQPLAGVSLGRRGEEYPGAKICNRNPMYKN